MSVCLFLSLLVVYICFVVFRLRNVFFVLDGCFSNVLTTKNLFSVVVNKCFITFKYEFVIYIYHVEVQSARYI
jgi:hypothetical protein